MHRLLLVLAISLSVDTISAQESPPRYFQRITGELDESIAIWISGDIAGGNQFSGSEGTHSAYGTLMATVRPDGIIHATWNYEIEGSKQSEEQLLKIEGDTLFIGEGELEERGPGQMVLKDPDSVVFEKALSEVPMAEPAVDSEDAKPYMAALKDFTGKLADSEVELDGSLRVTGGWVRFRGYLRAAEGSALKGDFSELQDREFQMFIKQDGNGGWKLVRHGFSTDQGYMEFVEASEEYEVAPWPLEEELIP